MTKNFVHPSLLLLLDPGSKILDPRSWIRDPGSEILDPGSGMGKNQDPGAGINILDPQHWNQVWNLYDKYLPVTILYCKLRNALEELG
jgi:hypothetical protein